MHKSLLTHKLEVAAMEETLVRFMSMPLIMVFLTAHACNTLLTIFKPLFQTLILAEIAPHLHQQPVSRASKIATQFPTGSIM